jgi:protein-S-isoprenylcysteine O-methyltransferase Ste14
MSDCTVFIIRFALFAAIHSILATRRSKEFTRRMAGGEMTAYRLSYNLLSLAMFAWVMATDGCATVLYFVPGAWSLLMYLCQFLIAAALFTCLRQTGAATFLGFGQLRGGKSSPTMTTGDWYSVVRHPLYLLCIVYLVLTPVMTTQRALLILLSIIYFTCGGLLEERRLLEEFGDQYRQYRRHVPFLIPRLRLSRPPSTD